VRRLLLALSFVVACEPAPQEITPGEIDVGNEVLLTVDEHKVTQRMVDVALAPAPPEVRDSVLEDDKRMKGLLESMALTELLYHKALEAKIHERDDVQDSMALAQREILGSFYMKQLAEERVTDEAVQERYTSLGARLNRPQAKVQSILVKKQDLANQLVEDINAGKIEFLAAAKEHSVEQGVDKHGGDLGWTLRAPIRELQEPWESAPLNEVIGPVEGRMGFHILRITERRDKVPLEEVEDKIRESLRQEALQSLRKEMLAEAELDWKDDAADDAQDAASGAEAGGSMEQDVEPASDGG